MALRSILVDANHVSVRTKVHAEPMDFVGNRLSLTATFVNLDTGSRKDLVNSLMCQTCCNPKHLTRVPCFPCRNHAANHLVLACGVTNLHQHGVMDDRLFIELLAYLSKLGGSRPQSILGRMRLGAIISSQVCLAAWWLTNSLSESVKLSPFPRQLSASFHARPRVVELCVVHAVLDLPASSASSRTSPSEITTIQLLLCSTITAAQPHVP